MARDDGRLVVHFGKDYVWVLNERGHLQLVALSDVLETARAATDVLRKAALPGQQPNTWAVSR